MSLFKTITDEDYYNQSMLTMCIEMYRNQEDLKHTRKKIKKQSERNRIKHATNLFKLRIENKAFKDRIIRDLRNLFELQEEKIIGNQ